MTTENQIIYDEVRDIYKAIKDGDDRLDEIRKNCPHEETELVNYMWRVGSINPNTEVCKFCGEVIQKERKIEVVNITSGSYAIDCDYI